MRLEQVLESLVSTAEHEGTDTRAVVTALENVMRSRLIRLAEETLREIRDDNELDLTGIVFKQQTWIHDDSAGERAELEYAATIFEHETIVSAVYHQSSYDRAITAIAASAAGVACNRRQFRRRPVGEAALEA